MALCAEEGLGERASAQRLFRRTLLGQGLLLPWRKVRYGLPARAGLSLRRKPLDQKETRTPCQP